MNITLYAEGKSDFQVIKILLVRILAERDIYNPQIDCREFKSLKTYQPKKSRSPFAAKVMAAIQQRVNGDALAIVIDRDRCPDSERLLPMQQVSKDSERTVVGVAVEMLESWLLADPQSWKAVFPKSDAHQHLPPHPEKCAGGPKSKNYPKTIFTQLLQSCNVDPEHIAHFRSELTQQIDLRTLSQKCPQGFGRIYDLIQEKWWPQLTTESPNRRPR